MESAYSTKILDAILHFAESKKYAEVDIVAQLLTLYRMVEYLRWNPDFLEFIVDQARLTESVNISEV